MEAFQEAFFDKEDVEEKEGCSQEGFQITWADSRGYCMSCGELLINVSERKIVGFDLTFQLAKGLLIGDTIFTTLKRTETFHTTDTHTYTHTTHTQIQICL